MDLESPCLRDLFGGVDIDVPLLGGGTLPYVNLDNAASTPAMTAVEQTVVEFLRYYSSVHRGTGFKSQVSTHAYEQARTRTAAFLGADPAEHVCIFGKNTTEMINRAARRIPFHPPRDVVIVSLMEHHSNDLPWRNAAQVVHCRVTPDGRLDEDHFDRLLAEYAGRVALVAITGASNVTGFINPYHRLAEKAHAAGAQILVDCAQLAPHRKVEMLPLSDPAHLDYTVISAHKMYAPFGTGALVGRRDTFEQGEPDHRGGGEVEFVTEHEVAWSEPPERDEAGSPNTIGAVALGAALAQLEAIGMDKVAAHEAELTAALLTRLREVPGLHILGDTDPRRAAERLGVVPFEMEGVPHFLLAAILGYEFGIGVRSGCFCAHPYLLHLLDVNEEQAARVRAEILAGDRRNVPGLVRVSFGLYNCADEIDRLIDALLKIRRGEYRGTYVQDPHNGEFHPQGWDVNYEDYFRFDRIPA